jgi:hypothetical protein
MAVSALVTNVTERYILRQAQNERRESGEWAEKREMITVVTGASGHIGANLIRALLARAVILALSRDKVGNYSGSDTNRRISSTIVN